MKNRIALAGTLLTTALLAAGGAAGQTSPDDRVSLHGLSFPAEVGGAQRISVRDYEKTHPGLGYSVGYRLGTMVGTVYVYDLGQTAIPESPRAPMIAAQLREAVEDINEVQRRGGYTKVLPIEEFAVEDGRQRPRLVCESFVVTRADQAEDRDTFVCLGGANNKFVKFRITRPREPGSKLEARKFLNAWIALLWPA
jgi:hypothetical protein